MILFAGHGIQEIRYTSNDRDDVVSVKSKKLQK